ncbi:hypothetical protein B7R54_14805 [Subtercola boreus]|uniref:DUF306 domain-containing protein n=1 Tax=Subtercola boreus TaxID=120213 RepID=A0A3E0VLJ0_9MICO|nr:META domain-containing protein [Subtercola boreus]RFA10338.1 hypothetical protein B7R54_14805 [Subtercola boreus]TQL56155.1 heat shock protein HslJ [Subtercola boreus]
MTKHTPRSLFGPVLAALSGLALVSLLAGCSSSASSPGADGGASGTSISIVGTWGDQSPRQPYLVFDEDSTVAGNDGCNSLGSTYELSGDTVTFSRTTSTMMACIGVDSWLSAVSTAVVTGDTMTVRNEKGDTIGTLTRSA